MLVLSKVTKMTGYIKDESYTEYMTRLSRLAIGHELFTLDPPLFHPTESVVPSIFSYYIALRLVEDPFNFFNRVSLMNSSYFTTFRRVFDSAARFLSWIWFLLPILPLRRLVPFIPRTNRHKREPVENTEGKNIERVRHSLQTSRYF